MNKVGRNVRHEEFGLRSQNSHRPSASRFIQLAQLRKWRECDQVAAVCYRRRGGEVEFLLVRTRGNGRWTFPKGSAERGLTQAQAAALEAFEEAGVHGRIEEAAFAQYLLPKRGEESRARARLIEKETRVNAYLCEVSRLSSPEESGRKRTWFSAKDAGLSLREGREKSDGAQLARVINKALARLQKLGGTVCGDPEIEIPQTDERPEVAIRRTDALSKVKFDFADVYRAANGASTFAGYPFPGVRPRNHSIDPAAHPSQCEVLEFGPSRRKIPKALGSGNL
jgi:8-oxo-dGTP pyrophosphatase MutT (NUDIX family)